MHIDRKVPSIAAWLPRLTAMASCIALAACGQNQNYSSSPNFITIGGTVSGLTGTLALNNNAADPLTIGANGVFTFALSLASGSAYGVAIAAQPPGQTCTLTNASGTSTSNVTNIGIGCVSTPTISVAVTNLTGTLVLQNNAADKLTLNASGTFAFSKTVPLNGAYAVTVFSQPSGQTCSLANSSGTASANVTIAVTCQSFTLRALPAGYTSGKAINYSPYRAGGPGVGEVPTDADIKQDLQLLQGAGFTLLRMFGADAVSTNVLKLAGSTTASLKFQVGIYLQGAPSSCIDTVNASQIAAGIAMANAYSNVAAVSVGNETSLAGNLPISCLVRYVQQVRNAVTQPVTADDDYTFYDGGHAGANYAPDTVLQNIDFVSIHTYPFTNTGSWNWQQLGVAAGPARAAAMMNAALAQAKATYALVSNYSYKTASGKTLSIGASLPITVGETGWKAAPTNAGVPIERLSAPQVANAVNAKWYLDLLATWSGVGAPVAIFPFEAFDEAWKGTDDGWGLWDKSRTARYALCDLPGQSACGADLYAGAGYYH